MKLPHFQDDKNLTPFGIWLKTQLVKPRDYVQSFLPSTLDQSFSLGGVFTVNPVRLYGGLRIGKLLITFHKATLRVYDMKVGRQIFGE